MNEMTGMKLKICGMREHDNIRDVALLKPDYMGFIFYPGSPRFVGEEFELPFDFPDEVLRTGVFVNMPKQGLIQRAKRYDLDFIQLHGDESPDFCKELKEEGLKVIKVFSVGEDFDFTKVNPYKSTVDYFLFDTKGKYYGGNARTFDWSLLNNYDQEVPFFLSGGISPYNVSRIRELDKMNIHAIDVNSGVESAPGQKDLEKIKNIKCEL